MPDPISPLTGKPMARDVRPITIAYRGAAATFDMPGWYSDAPDDALFSKQDMIVSDRELNKLKAQVEGLLSPPEIRRIRKKLGLTQRDAGHVIGGGPNAFQKYESGEVLPSRALDNLLRILARHPDELARLRQRRENDAA